MEEWSIEANKDGYLDWEGFSTGLARALQKDAMGLGKMADTQTPPTEAERMLRSIQLRKGCGAIRPVEAGEIEAFLSRCEGRMLVQALARTKKEMYRCELSLQQLISEQESKG